LKFTIRTKATLILGMAKGEIETLSIIIVPPIDSKVVTGSKVVKVSKEEKGGGPWMTGGVCVGMVTLKVSPAYITSTAGTMTANIG